MGAVTFAEVIEQVDGECDEASVQRLRDLEGMQRELDAARSVTLAKLDRTRAYAANGHASMHGLLRSLLGWSEAECRSRMRIARLVAAHAEVGETLFEASASTANIAAIAEVHANPRCADQIDTVLGTFLNEAGRMENADFRLLPKRWETLADADGADRTAQHTHKARNAHLNTFQGATTCNAQWAELDGANNQEIFEHFVQVEFVADWEATVDKFGDGACKALMPRTDAQRRADALTAIFNRAVTGDASKPAEPVVNIVIDYTTWTDLMTVAGMFPERNVDPFENNTLPVNEIRCETSTGEVVNPYTALQASIEGHVRFIVLNTQGIPIHWGRRRRLFTGAARQAVQLLGHRCIHPGCRVRKRQCQTDHLVEWHAGGETNPDNGALDCPRHNRLKHTHGYTATRDHHGHWHITRPDGTEVR